MALQSRLDAVFGALGGGGDSQPAWQPSSQQIFRSGGGEAGNSSEEEDEFVERERREAVPGLAQALAEEDEPDAEGFRPSTAFCRALDAEDEYNEIDEIATGLIAQRRGGDVLPPRSTQVPEDNPYEQRSRQRDAAAAGPEQRPTGMEVEEAGEALPAQQGIGGPSRSALAGSSRRSLDGHKKQVRFEGVAQPWVPPARRPGFQPRCTELPPGEGDAQAPGGGAAVQQRQSGLSVVPEHVKHPEKFTCYVLDEPLVVGGGVAQLSAASQRHDTPAAAGGPGEAQQVVEEERWEGPVGKGAVQFKPRQRAQEAADGGAAGGAKAAGAGSAAAARPRRPQLDFDDSGDAGVGDDAAEVAGQGAHTSASVRSRRQYRSSRTAGTCMDE